MQISEMVQQIQYVLAPAIMVSSSAMLLLGFQTKFSNIASRFRALSQEKRLLSRQSTRLPEEENRLHSLSEQLEGILKRAKLIKNAILCAYSAILCFTATSLLIFAHSIAPMSLWRLGLTIFGIGFVLIFMASFFMILEALIIYNIIKLEHHS